MLVVMIRHGKTKGNLEKRYIGDTNEHLCQKGIDDLQKCNTYLDKKVFVSPMNRCIETAEILFPKAERIICNDFRECSFGEFENKNYEELKGDSQYIKWLESGGKLDFPNGESRKNFCERTYKEFEKIIATYKDLPRISMVVHGGTIMALLDKYVSSSHSFYDWQIKNCQGYLITLNINTMTAEIIDKINENI